MPLGPKSGRPPARLWSGGNHASGARGHELPSCRLTHAVHGAQSHVRAENTATTLADRLEAIEKDKEGQLRRLQEQKREVERYSKMYEDLKRELEIVQASAAAV